METVNDIEFQEKVTLKQAYQIMEKFLLQFHERGELTTGDLIDFIGLLEDGSSADPAQLNDYIKVTNEVLKIS